MARKTTVLLTLFLALGFSKVEGQIAIHWETVEECIAATGAPMYYPANPSPKPLGTNEIVVGLPDPSCVEMDLPEAMGGRGWVRTETGRRFVANRLTGQVLRLVECNNNVYDVVPIPPVTLAPPPPAGAARGDTAVSVVLLRQDGLWRIHHSFDTLQVAGEVDFEAAALAAQAGRRGFCSRHTTGCVIGAAIVAAGGTYLLTRDWDGGDSDPEPDPEPTGKGPGGKTGPAFQFFLF